MWQCEASVDIQAPVEVVYRRLTDFTRHSDSSAGLAKVEQLTPGARAGQVRPRGGGFGRMTGGLKAKGARGWKLPSPTLRGAWESKEVRG